MICVDSWISNRLRGFPSIGIAIGVGFMAGAGALEASADTKLTPPDQIIRIMEESSLVYTIQTPTEPEIKQENPGGVLMPGLVLQHRDGTVSVVSQVLSPDLELRMQNAENRFKQRDFEGHKPRRR